MLKGFRDFLFRGNVVDLAVAVVIGAAFAKVVSSFVSDLLTPLIQAIAGKPSVGALVLNVNGQKIQIGNFLNEVLAFVLAAAVIYFFVVVPLNKITARLRRGGPTPDATTRQCPECLSTIPIAARRCAHCTSPLA